MANAYPNPCDKCDKADSCALGYGCVEWQIRYRYRQHQINAYAKRAAEPRTGRENKFTYQHPNDIRRYLANSPCKGCPDEKGCKVPCPDYLRWYNARMRVIRKKVGGVNALLNYPGANRHNGLIWYEKEIDYG